MIYLDHAATSFPKPPEVLAAVQRWFTELGVSADRGDSEACSAVAHEVARVRTALGALCGLPAERVAFCSGATEALNLLFRGLLQRGARVLTTTLEHSSVVRPLRALADEGLIEVHALAADPLAGIDPQRVADALRDDHHDLFVFTAASNVTGAVIDAAELSQIARSSDCVSICDASQIAGLLPLDVGADAVVASAHKSLLAPPGLGFVAIREHLEPKIVKQGGTGSSAALERHPHEWPSAFEAGTPNTPAIFGLGAALDWIAARGANSLLAHGIGVCTALEERLPAASTFVPTTRVRVPITSFTLETMDPAEIGILLAEAGVHVRTGFHCAPWIHAALGTERDGTVRVSPGPFVSEADAVAVAELVRP